MKIGDWVAIGFNPTASSMGPAPVLVCSEAFGNSSVVYFNQANHTGAPAFNHSMVSNNVTVEVEDGITTCLFSLSSNFTVMATKTSKEQHYDLNNDSMFLIMAVGTLSNKTIAFHTNQNRTKDKLKLSDKNQYYHKNESSLKTFYTNCQNSREYGCFISSDTIDNCSDSKNCDFGATWIGESENSYKVQLMTTTEEFVAIGFNPTASKMGPAPVVACSQKFKDLPAVYFNFGNHTGVAALNHTNMVSKYQVSVEDGVTTCEFSLNSSFSVTATNTSEKNTYNLNEHPSFVIMAIGPLTGGQGV